MAALAPVISHTIDYATSPVIDPPATEFPHPKEQPTRHDPNRESQDSDTTLTPEKGDAQDSKKDELDPAQLQITRKVLTEGSSPLAGRRPIPHKYDTEIARPVGGRPFIGALERRSIAGPVRPKTEDGSSEDFSSDDEDDGANHGALYKSNPLRLLQDRSDLSKAKLNKVKKFPKHHRLSISNEHFRTRGKVAKDGRLNISVNETANSGYLAKALGATLRGHLEPQAKQDAINAEQVKKQYRLNKGITTIPRMNIVIMVIGSRGDIQPFLKIGQILRDKYRHRVRIATHPTFRKFVQEEMGLEFFSVGGDPSELMSFMVKNPGLIPSFETLKAGEVGRRREQMFGMFQGFWRACINTTDDEKDVTNLKMLGNKFPFVADAIIANPPSFAHFHCAEKLGIPLHLVFTFPYSPTSAFPHPLANIKASNVDREYTNYMSYPLVDLMTWQGLGDLVNRFRVKTLGLEPVSTLWAPGQLSRLKVPMTYLWSPGLVPKPADWGPEIDIAGYVFLDLGSHYDPPEDLRKFLERSEDDNRHIVYIGFGSISGIDDPRAFCQMIFDAVVKAKVRAIVSRGWGGMGDGMDIPEDVFMIDNVPHDWLFPQVDAVVHHGGAGTTAAGLKFGKPTMIVPFFGDQPFWASEVQKSGAGANQALPLKQLDSDKFAKGIIECLEEETKKKAQQIAKSIQEEGDGAENAVDSFHRALKLEGKHSMRCGVFEDRVAVWKVRSTGFHLSALAAELLVENKQLTWSDLALLRHKHWRDFTGPGEPITGIGGVLMATFQEAIHGVTSISNMTRKDMKRIDRRKRKGKTVADIVAAPGRVVHKVRDVPHRQPSTITGAPLNLHGEAEPPRLAIFQDPLDQEDSVTQPRNLALNTVETRGIEPMSAPVVIVKDIGKGLGHTAKAFITLPLEVMNAVTLGFRNAPRLYGDTTVRPPPGTINNVRSGFRTAGKELWFGFYDGATGFYKIPHDDVKKDGFSSLPKGVARGFGGFLLKPIAGVLGVPTYTSKGFVASLRRLVRDTEKTERWLRRARMNEGAKDAGDLRKVKEASRRGGNTPRSRREGHLEQARTKALQRWTTHEREFLDATRTNNPTGSGASRTPLDRARTN